MNPAALASKQKNIVGMLNHIINCEEVSRPALAAAFNVSMATVTNIINKLISYDLVYEGGTENPDFGRKAKLIRFNAKFCYVLTGAIIDEQKMHLFICDLLGHIIDFEEVNIDFVMTGSNSEEEIVSKIIHAVLRFKNKQNPEIESKLTAVALSIPGLVNRRNSTIYAPFFNWKSLPIKKILQAAVNLPVYMENVTRIKAIYEMRYINEKEKNVIYLALSPGIGMVNFFDGKIIMGNNGVSGEAGHMSLDINGEQCYCGNRGCFELYCGELYLIRKGKKILDERSCDILTDLIENKKKPLTLQTMIEAKEAGSLKLYKLFKETSKYLGCGLTSLINCFDPDRIIISGHLVEMDKDTLKSAIEEAKECIVNKFSRDPVISLARLNDNDIQKALCAFVLEKILPDFVV